MNNFEKVQHYDQSSDFGKSLNRFFSSIEFLRLQSNEFGWIVVGQHIFSYYIQKRLKIFRYLVFTDINKQEESDQILEQLVDFVRLNLNVDFIHHPHANFITKFKPKHSLAMPFASVIKKIQLNDNDLLMSIHEKHRNVIRSAIKKGIIVELVLQSELKHFLFFQNEQKKIGREFLSFSHFQKLLSSGHVLLFQAMSEENVLAQAMISYDIQSAYYLTGSFKPGTVNGSMNLLLFEVMKYFRDIKVEHFDFLGVRIDPPLGSKLEGIRKFKIRFNGDEKKGFLWKYPFHLPKYKMFQLIFRTRQFIKTGHWRGDNIDQELEK